MPAVFRNEGFSVNWIMNIEQETAGKLEETEKPAKDVQKSKSIPGFESFSQLIGVLAAALYVKKF